jgi:hypothetical protein
VLSQGLPNSMCRGLGNCEEYKFVFVGDNQVNQDIG